MSTYPMTCQCCRQSILSKQDHCDHILQHQNDLGSLVKSLVQNSDQDREPCDRATVSKPYVMNSSLQNQALETRKRLRSPHDQESGLKAKRVRRRNIDCPDCPQLFLQPSDLERHRFTHYEWNKPCDDCQVKHYTASSYAQHLCKGQKPARGVIRSRQAFVEETLGIRIMNGRKELIQVKEVETRAPNSLPSSMQDISEGLWQSAACLGTLDFSEDGELVLD